MPKQPISRSVQKTPYDRPHAPKQGIFARLKSLLWSPQPELPLGQPVLLNDEPPSRVERSWVDGSRIGHSEATLASHTSQSDSMVKKNTDNDLMALSAQHGNPNDALKRFFDKKGDAKLSNVEVMGVLSLISQAVGQNESLIDVNGLDLAEGLKKQDEPGLGAGHGLSPHLGASIEKPTERAAQAVFSAFDAPASEIQNTKPTNHQQLPPPPPPAAHPAPKPVPQEQKPAPQEHKLPAQKPPVQKPPVEKPPAQKPVLSFTSDLAHKPSKFTPPNPAPAPVPAPAPIAVSVPAPAQAPVPEPSFDFALPAPRPVSLTAEEQKIVDQSQQEFVF